MTTGLIRLSERSDRIRTSLLVLAGPVRHLEEPVQIAPSSDTRIELFVQLRTTFLELLQHGFHRTLPNHAFYSPGSATDKLGHALNRTFIPATVRSYAHVMDAASRDADYKGLFRRLEPTSRRVGSELQQLTSGQDHAQNQNRFCRKTHRGQ